MNGNNCFIVFCKRTVILIIIIIISCKYTLDGHVSAVTSLAFSNDGAFLLSGGRDNVVNMWSVPKGERITTLPVYEVWAGIFLVLRRVWPLFCCQLFTEY